jgi:hypothetical protein
MRQLLKEVTLENKKAAQITLILWKRAVVFWQITVFLPCEELNARQASTKKEAVADNPNRISETCVLAPDDGTTQREGACFCRVGETQSGPTLTGVLSPTNAEHALESTSAHQSKNEELIIYSKQSKTSLFAVPTSIYNATIILRQFTFYSLK